MPEVGGGNIDYDRYKYVPDPEKQELPKDERDKYVAARKAAHEAKKAGGGGGGGKKKNKDNKAHRILSRLIAHLSKCDNTMQQPPLNQVLRLFLGDNLLKVGKALCKAVSGLLLAR
jgi:hypothetical protein